MYARRTNHEWLTALKSNGLTQERALTELRDYLLRVALLYLRNQRSDLADLATHEIRQFAEDLAQDALLQIQRNLDNFRGESKFTSWAYRFVINLAISELRRRRYRNHSLDSLPTQDRAIVSAIFGRSIGLETATELQGILHDLHQIVQEHLTERQRIAIQMVHFNGLAITDVAEELEIRPNALYKLLYDSRQKIKTHLLKRYHNKETILRLLDNVS